MLWMNYCPANDPAVLLKPGLLSAVKKVVPYVNVDCDDSSGESTPHESDDFDDESTDSDWTCWSPPMYIELNVLKSNQVVSLFAMSY